jgi:hypothetical protein
MRRWCSNSFCTLEELLDHITPRGIEEYRKSLPEYIICSSCGGRVWGHSGLRIAVDIQRLSSSNDMTGTIQTVTPRAMGFAQRVCGNQCPGNKAEWYIAYQRERMQAKVTTVLKLG